MLSVFELSHLFGHARVALENGLAGAIGALFRHSVGWKSLLTSSHTPTTQKQTSD